MTAKNLLPLDPPARVWSKERHCFVDDRAPEINAAIAALDAPYGGATSQPGSIAPMSFPTREQTDAALDRLSKPAATKGLPTEDKARKALPLWTFLMEYFPDAWLAVANVAIAGNQQHNPGEPLHWAREKSTDQMNTAFRHMWDHGRGVPKDTDGQYHLAKAIWRLSAELQLLVEKDRV